MAWSVPHTFVSGEYPSASTFNLGKDQLLDLDRRTTMYSDFVGASETTASTSYANLATPGPTVAVVVGSLGKALVNISAEMYNTVANSVALMSVEISGAYTLVADDSRALAYTSPANGAGIRHGVTIGYFGMNAGLTTFASRYRAALAGVGEFSERRLGVTPMGS